MSDEIDIWIGTHYERNHNWEKRVGIRGAARRGLFSKHEDLIKKHFGLEVWISHVRTINYQMENFWEIAEFSPPKTTCAWLKLPGARENFNSSNLTKMERDDKFLLLESGYGMRMKMPKPLLESARDKFKRMMNVLDLQPWVQFSQEDTPLTVDESADGEGEDSDTDCGSAWSAKPQLTTLIRCITRSDEED